MIQELIYQKFGVLYSVKYLSEFLKNLGFSYQKARFAVGGKNPENTLKRKIWIEQTLPEIVAKAQKQKAYLLFGDEVSFPQWGSITYTWLQLDTNLLFLLREYEKAIKYSDLSTTFPAGSSTKLLRAASTQNLIKISFGKSSVKQQNTFSWFKMGKISYLCRYEVIL